MSAGNPFRRKPQQSHTPEWHNGDVISTSRQFTPPQTDRRRSSVKKVRIQTPPPLSPDSIEDEPIVRRISAEAHEGSPPPDPDRIDPSVLPANNFQTEDPFARFRDDEELFMSEEVINNTRRNSASNSAATVEVSVPIIRNPFQRTLATMESPQARSLVSNPGSTYEGTPMATETDSKQTMDVDAFKRLLLTGNADSTLNDAVDYTSSPPGSANFVPVGTSGGAADTSSEDSKPLKNVDTTHIVMAGSKSKPAPPAHRHGRSVVQPRTPQVVSFLDFSPTDVPRDSPKQPVQTTVPPPLPRHRDAGHSSDPAAPDFGILQGSTDVGLNNEPSTPQALSTQYVPGTTHLNPPPPPLARRSSQMTISRGASSAEVSVVGKTAMLSEISSKTGADSPAKSSKAPPPPPSRRMGARSTPSSEPSVSDKVDRATTSSSRSSSIASHNRTSMVPPIPPPRRRGSSKSSIDAASRVGIASPSPRASLEDKRTSISSLERATQTLMAGKGDDVLADMAALQAEIDALRAQYKKGA